MMNVLLVDDEPWILEGLRTMVDWNRFGFRVCGEAMNSNEAFRQIEEHRPDLVFTDINMPEISGLELIEKSNRLLQHPPKFVVLSGYDDFQYAITAMQQRVVEYLLKPIDDEEIEALLLKLGEQIREEEAAKQLEANRQLFAVNHVINRLILGEYNSSLVEQAHVSMNLTDTQQMVCMIMETAYDLVDFGPWGMSFFPPGLVFPFQDSAGRCGFIVLVEMIPDGQFHEITQSLLSDLKARSDRSGVIAISDRDTGIEAIRGLYLQSVEVRRIRRNQEKQGVFYYRDIHRIEQPDIPKAKFKQLIESVESGNLQQIESGIISIFETWFCSLPDMEVVRVCVSDLELKICKWLTEMNGDPAGFMRQVQIDFAGQDELDEMKMLKGYVHSLCLLGATQLGALRKENEHNTIFQVIQYVDLEFRNKLQLRELAAKFHMNSAYLGQLFKQYTSKPFNEYLNEKRIEEAKKLLKRTQTKISKVALQVGYPNADYFNNKFKQYTGVLPSIYRGVTENRQQ
ncbi:response regulator [Paenibacillus sp. D2_2]|uniref:response regulator transcription factor n=1 Tax=Paenibacillus sp. D2_2 TaxID=3073092 RepID=UPI002814E382|nr:response regulator [Paenibacillus sp. D2_2]WMT40794.1 response regulator [Paenibacillus sp. D2_2]